MSIRHVNTQGGYLHSHPHPYPGGSKRKSHFITFQTITQRTQNNKSPSTPIETTTTSGESLMLRPPTDHPLIHGMNFLLNMFLPALRSVSSMSRPRSVSILTTSDHLSVKWTFKMKYLAMVFRGLLVTPMTISLWKSPSIQEGGMTSRPSTGSRPSEANSD